MTHNETAEMYRIIAMAYFNTTNPSDISFLDSRIYNFCFKRSSCWYSTLQKALTEELDWLKQKYPDKKINTNSKETKIVDTMLNIAKVFHESGGYSPQLYDLEKQSAYDFIKTLAVNNIRFYYKNDNK